jgi:ribosomal-protein-alanine N-acetyltransferase
VNGVETARLTLEAVTIENAPTLWRVMQRPHLRDFQDVPRVPCEEFVRRVASRPSRFDGRASGRFEWIVRGRNSTAALGWVSLRVGEAERRSAEVGYSLLLGARGKGYAREAVRAVMGIAFDANELARVEACCIPTNAASRKLLANLGFTEVRTQHRGAVVRGQAVDIVISELTRAAWEKAAAPAVKPGAQSAPSEVRAP